MVGKRVVVTGLSAVTPIGNTLQDSWANLLAGKPGIGPLTQFDCSDHATKIAAELKNFEPHPDINPKQARRMDRFVQIAVTAALQLMEDAGWTISKEEAREVGVILGCGLGGLDTIEKFHTKLMKSGPGRVSPFFIPMLIANMAPGQVAMFTGAMGANLSTTSACASATHGIGYAFSDIKLGRAKAMITGGVESTITPMGVSGFNAMKALSTDNDCPEKASRPFDATRTGFVIGEGSGMLLLEDLDHALARGANIYAEMVGYGASDDAYHMTAPNETGEGMALSMLNALRDAGVAPEQIDHINAHGTSTKLNDLSETRAIKKVFGDRAYDIPITANKSQIGHLLGAAGGAESVIACKTLQEGIIPGTINLENPDPECDLDYCADGTRTRQAEYVLLNNFGFGGTNASLLFKKFEK